MIRARGVLGIGPLSPSRLRQIILTPALQAYTCTWSFNVFVLVAGMSVFTFSSDYMLFDFDTSELLLFLKFILRARFT